MSKDKEIISRLFKIVAKQQAAITKLAQSQSKPAVTDLRAVVQADVIDAIYGKNTKLVPGKTYAQVFYAKLQSTPQGNTLAVGLSVPPNAQEKWNSLKNQIDSALKTKYSSMLGQPISAIVWKE